MGLVTRQEQTRRIKTDGGKPQKLRIPMTNAEDLFDPTKYEHVIKDVLMKLKIPIGFREDLIQECYLVLLQKKDFIQFARNDLNAAAVICRHRAIDWLRGETKYRSFDRVKLNIHPISLSDPSMKRKLEKISSPNSEPNIADEPLYMGLFSLNLDEYRVLYSIYIDGKSQEATAGDLGITRSQVRILMRRGVKNLRKYFEVE